MAIGESRRDAKIAKRQEHYDTTGERTWTVSTGKIHSHITRKVYQQHVLHFMNWCRSTYHINRLEQLDERAEELVSAYLLHRIDERRSPYTLLAERSALRLFFDTEKLAEGIALPKRIRENITRSRLPTKQDAHFQPENWPELINFLKATGLRREEVEALFVYEICVDTELGDLVVYVRNGKGGQARVVQVLPGQEKAVLTVKAQRPEQEHAFERVPKNLDVHALRREYAQAFYRYLSGRELPPTEGRLKPSQYDRTAAKESSEQLGHHRSSIVTGHYIR
jgi:site-specific recombinase XerD